MELVGRSASPRPTPSNTASGPARPAPLMENQVPEAVKDERLQRLQALLNAQQVDFNRAMIGRVLPVLLEKPGKRAGPAGRPLALSAGGACEGRSQRDRPRGRSPHRRYRTFQHVGSRVAPEPRVIRSNPASLQEAVA